MKKSLFAIIFITLVISVVPTISLLTFNNQVIDKNTNNIVNIVATEKSNKISATTETASIAEKNNTENYFRIYDTSSKKILQVSDKEFCCNALITQVESDYPTEALKALAVTIHTYYSYIRENKISDNDKYDFKCNSKVWEIYVTKSEIKEKWGATFNDSYSIFEKAVGQVENQLIYYNNKLCTTPFFEISNGTTNSYKEIYGTDIPYLINTPSPFDTTANNYKLTTVISKNDFDSTMKSLIKNYNNKNSEITNIQKNNFGTVLSLDIGNYKVSGLKFSNSLKLRSSSFDIELIENEYNITTYGYGENVGLSKYGAAKLADQGYTYKEILKYYFYGVELI